MKICRIAVSNYRCIGSIDVEVDPYTAFIGINGTGKSSILYALAWFFGEPTISMTPEDQHKTLGLETTEVKVTFEGLLQRETDALGKFARTGTVCITRTFDRTSQRSKYTGTAHIGPGFETVYDEPSLPRKRTAYTALRQIHSDLPELHGTYPLTDLTSALATWESSVLNQPSLQEMLGCDANELFVNDGVMSQLVKFVLIPGSADLSQQLGADIRGSAIHSLTAGIVLSSVAATKAAWELENAERLAGLGQLISDEVTKSTGEHTDSVNAFLQDFLPSATVQITASIPSFTLRGEPSLSTKLFIDGEDHGLTAQGHGNQRAVLMAFVQSLARVKVDGSGDQPLVIITAEEPEIYQHPIRSRHFARTLMKISEQDQSQVLIATHSPYFVRPENLASLRRVTKSESLTSVKSTSLSDIAIAMGSPEAEVRRRVEKEIPRHFTEGYFSKCVVLVEGDTDRTVIECIADLLDSPLDAEGITVFSTDGKDNLNLYFQLLRSLDTLTYVVVDGDDKPIGNRSLAEAEQARSDWRTATEKALSIVSPTDENRAPLPFAFGDATLIGFNMALFHDDIEEELRAWPSFRPVQTKKKDVYAYRAAVQAANKADLPANLYELVGRIITFASS